MEGQKDEWKTRQKDREWKRGKEGCRGGQIDIGQKRCMESQAGGKGTGQRNRVRQRSVQRWVEKERDGEPNRGTAGTGCESKG